MKRSDIPDEFNGRKQLVGFAVAHVLDDGEHGQVEWFEDVDGVITVHQSPSAAKAARDIGVGVDPQTWQVIELRIVPENGAP